MVPRPRRLEVEHTGLDGVRTVTVFTDAMARLVCHEVDHLYGALYTARMRIATPSFISRLSPARKPSAARSATR